jgi:hypothetical protein
MARARTGTLVPPGADGIWRARVTNPKSSAGGRAIRPLYSLGTTDKAVAKRKLAKLVAASIPASTWTRRRSTPEKRIG